MARGKMRVRRRESLISDGGRGGAIGIAAKAAFAFLAAGACGLAGLVGRRTEGPQLEAKEQAATAQLVL